jgi:hypothetical protein
MSSGTAMNPTGGAESRHVMERCPLALVSVQLVVSTARRGRTGRMLVEPHHMLNPEVYIGDKE